MVVIFFLDMVVKDTTTNQSYYEYFTIGLVDLNNFLRVASFKGALYIKMEKLHLLGDHDEI